MEDVIINIIEIDDNVDIAITEIAESVVINISEGGPGPQGEDGLSAYQIAVNEGFVGNEAAWLASLVGADGADSTVPGPPGADSTVPGPAGADTPQTVTTAQMNAISSPTNGMLVYNSEEEFNFTYTTEWGWTSEAIGWRRKFGTEYFNEFVAPLGGDGFLTNSSSSGSITYIAEGNRPGIHRHSTGVSATGSYGFISGGSLAVNFAPWGGRIVMESAVMIEILSDAAQRYSVMFGFTGNTNTPVLTNAIVFLYDEGGVSTGNTASGFWKVATALAGSRQFTTTAIPVAINTWYKLKIVVNAGGTQVDFYINDVLVITETGATIPTASMGIRGGIIKSIGTTPRLIRWDYFYFKQKFTTAR